MRSREARAVGHALAQCEFGKFAQLFHRGGGRFDDVAELGVVADLQTGDAVVLRVVELQRRKHATAVVAQGALGVEFGVETGADGVAVVQPMRCRIGQRVGEAVLQGWIDVEGGDCGP